VDVVAIGGLDWGFDDSQVLSNKVQGYNISMKRDREGVGESENNKLLVYSSHPYDYGEKQPNDWYNAFGYLNRSYPIFLLEFGQYPKKKKIS
jgi:endoglucanase